MGQSDIDRGCQAKASESPWPDKVVEAEKFNRAAGGAAEARGRAAGGKGAAADEHIRYGDIDAQTVVTEAIEMAQKMTGSH